MVVKVHVKTIHFGLLAFPTLNSSLQTQSMCQSESLPGPRHTEPPNLHIWCGGNPVKQGGCVQDMVKEWKLSEEYGRITEPFSQISQYDFSMILFSLFF